MFLAYTLLQTNFGLNGIKQKAALSQMPNTKTEVPTLFRTVDLSICLSIVCILRGFIYFQ